MAENWIPGEIASREGQMDPYPFFESVQADGPMRYDEERDTFDVVGYDAVTELITSDDIFTRRNTSYIQGSLLSTDDPLHAELRGMAAPYFTPGFLRSEFRPRVEERADQLLDAALEDPDDIQFVEEIAKPLPILLIAEILNIPSEKMDTFRKWSTTLATAPEDTSSEAAAALQEKQATAMEELMDLFDAELERREEEPTDDIIADHLEAMQESDRADRDNILANLAMLLIAGNVTTTQLFTNAIWTLDEEGLVGDVVNGGLGLEDVTEEVLRYRSPVMVSKRIATEDTTLAGFDIEEGQRVVGWLSAANRDGSVYEAPHEFRPDRDFPEQPVAFGGGIHYCLGAPLARMEADVLFSKFFDRIDDLDVLTDEFDPFFSSEIYGPTSLRIAVST